MSPGFEIVPCSSTFDSDKITSILTVFLGKIQRGFGFSCSVNHFIEGGVNKIHNVTCSPSLAEILRMTLDCSRIAKEIAIVSDFFLSKEGGAVDVCK